MSGCGCSLVAFPKMDADAHVRWCGMHRQAFRLRMFAAVVAGDPNVPEIHRAEARAICEEINTEVIGEARKARVINAAERFALAQKG